MAVEDEGQTFDSLEELRDEVEKNGGLLTVEMWEVRDAYGSQRLGRVVREGIHDALVGLGLAHYPAELPDRQSTYVRVYKQGSPAANVIGAVLRPTPDTDDAIREAVGGDASAVVAQIRELVC